MHGALYRRYPAARREGAVFDQCALDLLLAVDRGLDRGAVPVLPVTRNHHRKHCAVVALALGRGGDRGAVLDREGLVPPLDHPDRRHQHAGGPQDRLHQAPHLRDEPRQGRERRRQPEHSRPHPQLRQRHGAGRRRGRGDHRYHCFAARLPQSHHRAIGAAKSSMAVQQNSPHGFSGAPASAGAPASTVDPAEVAKFSKLSDEWWNPNGKMAPLHKINPLRLSYIRDAACRKFERNVKSLSCLSVLRILDIGPGAGLLCEPFTRLGAQVIGVDPSATNIAAAKLHADKGHLSIDYRCTTVEQMDVRERFDIVLAMEVVEHVADVGMFLNRCAAMLKPGGLMVISTLNRNWKSFALAIVGAEYVLRWLPRGTHQWDKFVTPDELAHHLDNNKLAITDQAGVFYSPFADRWSLSSDMDVNYMVVAEGV